MDARSGYLRSKTLTPPLTPTLQTKNHSYTQKLAQVTGEEESKRVSGEDEKKHKES